MKKIIIGLCVLFGAVSLNAQDTDSVSTTSSSSKKSAFFEKSNKDLSFTSKNGHEVLPQGGDWGIGISANQPLEFVGSLFSNAGGNSNGAFSGVNGVNNSGVTIFGKYFVNSHTAFRGFLSTNNRREVTITEVEDEGATVAATVNSRQTDINRGVTVGFGLEKRRGNARLIGIYGAQAFVGFDNTDITRYDYANEISANNPTPNEGDRSARADVLDNINDERILETQDGSRYELGLMGFIGVEYFVAPRISIGGEFNLGVNYNPTTQASTLVEYFDPTSNSVQEFQEVDESQRSRELTSLTSTFGGNINLFFYF